MTKKTLTVVCWAVFCLALASQSTFGQDAGAEGSKTIFSVMFESVASGMIFSVLFLISIAGVALIIEHFISLRRDKLIPPDLVNEIEALLEEGEYPDALDLCDAEPSMLTNVVGAAIPKVETNPEAMADTVREVGDEEGVKLQQKIGWLSLIGNIAPMLGLLGTVIGMIQAFQTIANSPSPPSPKELAGGISTALFTTAFGLIIAIPMMSFYFFFRNRVIRITMETAAICDDLVDRIRPAE